MATYFVFRSFELKTGLLIDSESQCEFKTAVRWFDTCFMNRNRVLVFVSILLFSDYLVVI